MKIEESNRLLAEFMGEVFKGADPQVLISEGRMKLSNVKYNTSWEWLMPVVEKIESIYNKYHGYFGVYISSNSCTIQGTHLDLSKSDMNVYFNEIVLDNKLNSTYQAIVQFIDWYNDNIKIN